MTQKVNKDLLTVIVIKAKSPVAFQNLPFKLSNHQGKSNININTTIAAEFCRLISQINIAHTAPKSVPIPRTISL